MSWIDPPSDFDTHSLAEFMEAELMFSEDDYLSLTEVRNLFANGRQPTDEELTFAFAAIERRREDWGSHYPFLVDERGIALVRDNSSALYLFLLLMSLKGTPMRERREYARSDSTFDALVREAFQAFFGPSARALVFAWPPRGERPTRFDRAVEWAAVRMGIPVRPVVIPEHLQDGGVDVMVWLPFPDGRNGFQIFLVQNTVQWSFRKKPHDVRPQKWYLWWHIGQPPAVGFAVPFAMPEGDIWWDDVTEGAAVVLDRGRLMHALRNNDPSAWPEWDSLLRFVEEEISEVRATGEFSPAPRTSIAPTRKKAGSSHAGA